MKRLLLGLTICCLYLSNTNSQQFNFTNFGEYEGLSNSLVQCIVQDSTGYMWIGTNHGLYWYDGQYFDVFNYDASDSTSIAEDNITALYVDPNKKILWVGTDFGSISQFNTSSFKSTNYQRRNDEEHHQGMSAVHSLLRYKNYIFIGTRNKGLQVLNLNTNEYTDVLMKGSSNYAVEDIKKVGSKILLATSKGMYQCDISVINDSKIEELELRHYVSTDKVISFSAISDTSILYCTNRRITLFDSSQNSKQVIVDDQFKPAIIRSHFVDAHQNIWVGTNGKGIYILNLKGEILKHFIGEGNKKSLVNNSVSSLCGSKNQPLIWAGTKDGLSMIDYSTSHFKHFSAEAGKDNSTDDLFFLLKHSNNTYWYWSHRGLFYSKTGKNFKLFEKLPKNYGNIWAGIENKEKQILLCSNKGLIKINPQNNEIKTTSFRDDNFSDKNYDFLTGITQHNSDLWFATGAGIICYNETTKERKVFPFPENYKTNGRIRTSCIEFDKKGGIWIGDRNGYLISLNPKSGAFNRYSTTVKVAVGNVLRHNLVIDIYPHSNDELWLGTYGAGLLKFNLQSKKISAVSSNENLNSNVYKIIKDNEGYYWMNTNNKIVRYDADKNRALIYGRLDGTFCREFNDGASFSSNNGHVLLGGFGGFIEFNVNHFNYNKTKPFTDINSFYVDNESGSSNPDEQYKLEYIPGDTLQLNTSQKQISFYCSALNYISPEKNMVAWKLDGLEEKWDTLYAYDYKFFSELPAGKYTLKAKACNNDQVWSNREDKLFIVVKPTFRDSIVFKLLLIFIPLLVIYLIFLARTRYLIRHKQQLEQSVSERTQQLQEVNAELEESREEVIVQKSELERHKLYLEDLVWDRTVDLEKAKEKAESSDRLKSAFLANLSHEIRTPMNSIVGFSTLLVSDEFSTKERAEFASMVQKSSDSLLVLIDDIIDISRIEAGEIQLTLHDFCVSDLCQTAFKTLSFKTTNKAVNYKIDTSSVDGDCLIHSDPERLKQIFINLLNNAIKFTEKGHVILKVLSQKDAPVHMEGRPTEDSTLPDEYYLFIIEDTGIGIDKKHHEHIFSPFQKIQEGKEFHEGIGLGLSIVKQLIGILGGKIWIESEPGKGTQFFFYLPKQLKSDS